MKYDIAFDNTKDINTKYAAELTTMLPQSWTRNEQSFDILFIIGGDGSFLKYIQNHLMNPDLKVVFINSGRLGFYSYLKDLKNFSIEEVLNPQNYVQLDLIEVNYQGNVRYALNDFSYYSNYTSEIGIFINDVLLQTIHGNGVLVTTPTGSTARNKSLGGAILMPNTNVFSLIEIEAINNRYYSSLGSPIVFHNSERIVLKTMNYKNAFILYDGHEITIDEPQSILEIKHAKSKTKFLIHMDNQNWVNKLNYAFK